MFKQVTASVIAIGTELSSGKIQDKHGKYASSILSGMGFTVDSIVLIPDNENIPFFIESRKDKIDLLIITGGLGPTSDDITRSVIADASGVELILNNDIWTDLKKRFPENMNDSRKKQAYIPKGYSVINNFCGTAPGFTGYIGNTLVYCLPGPPSEMKDMFERSVVPSVIKKFNLSEPEIQNITCFLICESSLENACIDYKNKDITWGTRVQEYRISLYLQGGSQGGRQEFLTYLQNYFGKELIVSGDWTAEEILVHSLKKEGKIISLAESVTGGLIGKLITDISGSSKVLWGSLVTYSNNSKQKVLGIKKDLITDNGVVSKEVVEEMTFRVMFLADSDISLSVSGYAGGSHSVDEDTGNIWIAVKSRNTKVFTKNFKFTGSRDLIRRKTAVAAMLLAEYSLVRPERLDSSDQWQYS
ncbi:MAG: nicotinamide-nucleotide amidohydrolase family protein [Spirochaetota bacterium]|nr:nicotinamide-nucleotide amidohydrolase family protein [Spirochaetota bacterium]